MKRFNTRWAAVILPVGLMVGSASPGRGQGNVSDVKGKEEPAKPAPVTKTEPEKTETPLQFRFEVLELRLSSEEVERINRSSEAVDVAALASTVIERGDARVKYSLGGPVVLDQEAKFSTGQRIPFTRGEKVSDSGMITSSIQYEDVGCRLDLLGLPSHESSTRAILVRFNVELSELVSESTVELATEVRAPIFLKHTQRFAAHVSLGKDAYFWALSSHEQVGAREGGTLVHVYRVRFDPQPED